jgi:hypothetical protein
MTIKKKWNNLTENKKIGIILGGIVGLTLLILMLSALMTPPPVAPTPAPVSTYVPPVNNNTTVTPDPTPDPTPAPVSASNTPWGATIHGDYNTANSLVKGWYTASSEQEEDATYQYSEEYKGYNLQVYYDAQFKVGWIIIKSGGNIYLYNDFNAANMYELIQNCKKTIN